MSDGMTSFTPGDCIAVVTANTWLLVRSGTETLDASRLWDAVTTTPGVTGVLDALSTGTLGRVPDFALAVRDGAVLHVLVRGALRVSTTGQSGQLLAGEGVSTWIERVVDLPDTITLHQADESRETSGFLLSHGVVPASCLSMSFAEAPSADAIHVPIGEADPADSGNAGSGQPEQADAPSLPSQGPAEPSPDVSGLQDGTLPASGEIPPEVSGTSEEEMPDEATYGSDTAREIDTRSVAGQLPLAAPGDAPSPPESDDGSATIRRPYSAERPTPPPSVGASPMVHARTCPNGHLNPPHAHECRVCHTEISSESLLRARRPPMGVLVLREGKQFALDRTVVIGRAPTAPNRATQVPGLIAVEGRDVSRNHLELRIEDWSVLAVDLNSANGTTVTLPDRLPVRLRANDPMLIVPGTTISLADDVELRYEAR